MSNTEVKKIDINPSDKSLMAVYALNMCTVSVSQIVDYNDEYILEQEYDAILNNLNLEYIPKDSALRNILMEILNTITFFRINGIKKKQIEKKYQQRMKDAIWSAVPNFSFAVGGIFPAVVSLVTQVGIGYMNYRKEKASIARDKENDEIELRITLIEQLNALRRELFSTAWELAKNYEFNDALRLTERQIAQYNEMITDTDPVRRFDRLEYVKDSFYAYPPFWYFLAHAANEVYVNNPYGFNKELLSEYSNAAKKYFSFFMQYEKCYLLRQDQLMASCALEYADLIALENPKEALRLIGVAEKYSQNYFDTVQLCAIGYLKLGDNDKAIALLERLVNEEYNKVTNAQLLAGVYISEIKSDNKKYDSVSRKYEKLVHKVDSTYMLTFPARGKLTAADLNKYSSEYMANQRVVLAKMYAIAIQEFINQYAIVFNKSYPVPYLDKEYNDSYFSDDTVSKSNRYNQIVCVLQSDGGNDYLYRLKNMVIANRFLDVMDSMYKAIIGLGIMQNADKGVLYDALLMGVDKSIKIIEKCDNQIRLDGSPLKPFREMYDTGFNSFTKSFFDKLNNILKDRLAECMSLNQLSEMESCLIAFCEKNGIASPEVLYEQRNKIVDIDTNKIYFGVSDLSEETKEIASMVENRNKMARLVVESLSLADNAKTEIFTHEDKRMKQYLSKKKNDSIRRNYESEIVAAVADNGILAKVANGTDIIFLMSGILTVSGNTVSNKCSYADIDWEDGYVVIDNVVYKGNDIDPAELFELCEKLGEV